MLDKLGDTLKKAMNKLAGAVFIDKKIIEEIISELKRSLLEADVDLKIVNNLCDKIRAKANEKIPGLEKKDQLIKLIHDELTEILGGEEHELKIDRKKKPFKIMLQGLYGCGKCVHPNTLIPLSNGNVKTIKELYEKNNNKESQIDGGFIKKNVNIPIFAFNPKTLKIERKKASNIWKLKKTAENYKISLDNGNNDSIITTPEHPFFVLENGSIKQKRADKLRANDLVAVPKFLPYENEEQKLKILDNNLLHATRIKNKSVAKNLKEFLKIKFGNMKNAMNKLNIHRTYCIITAELKIGEIDYELLKKCILNGFEFKEEKEYIFVRSGGELKFPSYLTQELAEFMGYVYGDGNIDKNGIYITNKDKEIIKRIQEISLKLFGVKVRISKDKRSKLGLVRMALSRKLLVEIITNLFGLPKSKKSDCMKLPKFMFCAKKDIVNKFLQAYFDCDGYVNGGTRHIEFCTASKDFAYHLRLLLLKNSIIPTYSIKYIKNKPYYRVFLGAGSAEIFTELIESKVKEKSERLKQYKYIKIGQSKGKLENLNIGKLLKEIREYYGASIGEIQNYVSSYGLYEKRGTISKDSLNKFLNCLSSTKNLNNKILSSCSPQLKQKELAIQLSNINQAGLGASVFRLKQQGFLACDDDFIQITPTGDEILQKNIIFDLQKLNSLKLLVESDISWAKVSKIKVDKNSEFVYDLTVEKFHNFVANGVIIHNTTQTVKIALYYGKRGFKTCVLGLDVHRPAAPEQLEQFASSINIPSFVDKNEKNALAIWKRFQNKIKKFDVVIIDTAGRDVLSSDLINELKDLYQEIAPDKVLLVMPADIGKAALNQAKGFTKASPIDGVIVTRLDGTAKGGGALASCYEAKAPVIFVGVGEKPQDIEIFDPSGFVSRLLGLGDLKGLIEKAKLAIEEKDQVKIETRLEEGKFTLDDLHSQIKAMQSMGPLNKIAEMIPGLSGIGGNLKGKMPQLFDVQEKKLKHWKFAIDSCTKEEKEDPEKLNSNRIARISKGSNVPTNEIREMVKQHKLVKGFMSGGKDMDALASGQFDQRTLQKLAKKFGKRKRLF